MNPSEQANLATARRYLELLEHFADPAAFEEIIHPDVLQEEYPNLLMPRGQQRDREALFAGMRQGGKLLTAQRFDLRHALAAGDWVAMEIVWTGTLAIDLGSLAAGSTLKAYIATILQFKDGRIILQRNYDCYEPLPL